MAKTLKERIDENKQAESRAAFSGYVQSVAFNMTLSRNMVDGLANTRDYWHNAIPMPTVGDPDYKSPRLYENNRSVPLMKALERRGLVWHDYVPPTEAPRNHRYYKLTRAGELMCELLVEAGLIQAAPKVERKRSAR